ncbi:MAG: sulfite exporter TauE/SafE family protein [Candidatus Loosdrechtia sp.]|uniref:sulfite exporter TauE/SafE family protein n=1 Tax=Candidatus Loosdrechtia sp. TaxID=3101272 RepID=UPI00403A8382
MTAYFSVSGVETWLWLPPLVAFVISFFSSMAGISGAFLLLPFQMSVLNFTSPSVSSTNLVFNLVATPSGIWCYAKEGRMAWPLTWIIVLGTLPGVIIGYYVRILYLPDPGQFKLFAGCVLLYIGYRLLSEFAPWKVKSYSTLDEKFKTQARQASGFSAGLNADATIRVKHISLRMVKYDFWGETFSFSTPGMFMLAFVVGIIGGIYGIGGGAIIAPFCVAIFGLPVYTVAGAALAGTLATSVVGVVAYSVLPAPAGLPTRPDWLLGLLFGIGGIAGMYLGVRFQKFVPQTVLKMLLGGILLLLALQYIAASLR